MLPSTDKMIFLDIIIDDDSGEKDEKKDIVPYQLSKEAVVMDMKVQDITVRSNADCFCNISTSCTCGETLLTLYPRLPHCS